MGAPKQSTFNSKKVSSMEKMGNTRPSKRDCYSGKKRTGK